MIIYPSYARPILTFTEETSDLLEKIVVVFISMCYCHGIDSTCAEYVRPLTDRDRRNPSYKARLGEMLISDVSVTDGATWFDLGRSPLSTGFDLAPGSCGTRYPITASTREFRYTCT